MGARQSNAAATPPDTSNGAPKSFYLVLGGPPIRYYRPGRGPLIFEVEPMKISNADAVEHAEVVRPCCHIPTKQKFQLVPTLAAPSSITLSGPQSQHPWSWGLRFALEFHTDRLPLSLSLYVDVQLAYRPAQGIVLHSEGSAAPRCVWSCRNFSTPSADLGGNTALHRFEVHEAPDRLFDLLSLTPSMPKSELTAPASLKACPMVLVVEFETVPPAPRPSPSQRRQHGQVESDAIDSSAALPTVARLYTCLTFNKDACSQFIKQRQPSTNTTTATAGADGMTHEASAESGNDIELTTVNYPQAEVVKQMLEFNGEVYELDDIYDLGGDDIVAPPTNRNGDVGSSAPETPAAGGDGAADRVDGVADEISDDENVCVICLTNPKDTTVIPCRHLCLCAECAVQLKHQSNKCPICRRPIERLMTM